MVKQRKPPLDPGGAGDPSVAAFLRECTHPLAELLAPLRAIVLSADPSIREGIKWNAPSFHTSVDFATMNLSAKDRVRLVMHTGAKRRPGEGPMAKVSDPEGLLEWLAADRAVMTLRTTTELKSKRAALTALLREWITAL